MLRALALLTLAAAATSAPSDYLHYEGTKNGGRVTLRQHAHAFAPDGYRPVTPTWNDFPLMLMLSAPKSSGKLKYKLDTHQTGAIKIKGDATVNGDEATVTIEFSAKGGELEIKDGTATVTMKIDATRGLVVSATATILCATVGKDGKKPFDEKWTIKLNSGRKHGAPGFQQAVDTAIDRGVALLKSKQNDNGTYPPRGEYAIGTTALCAFTLSSCDVPRSDPAVAKAIAYLVAQTPRTTYDRAVALMALDRAYTPPGELARAHKRGLKEFKRDLPDARRAWAMKVAEALERNASKPGSWAYGKRRGEPWPDTSNTQYAVLGLRAAARLGYKADPRTWLGVLQHFRIMRGKERLSGNVNLWREGEAVVPNATRAGAKVKKREGNGFRYRGNRTASTATMTTAAIASLLIAGTELERLKYAVKPKTRKEIDRAVLGAWLWLDRHWAMARAPGHLRSSHRLYYYLYAVERAAVLDRVKRVGNNDWYFEGASFLLDTQRKSGAWERDDAKDNVNTCFALLFLKRATAPLTLTR